jgi:hypothetical protein
LSIGPLIRGGELSRSRGPGVEGEEVDSELGEVSASEAGKEVGGGVRFDDGLSMQVESFFSRVVGFGEEVTGVRDVPFGPTDLVHFREVFHEVGVSVQTSLDLPQVNDESAC